MQIDKYDGCCVYTNRKMKNNIYRYIDRDVRFLFGCQHIIRPCFSDDLNSKYPVDIGQWSRGGGGRGRGSEKVREGRWVWKL